MNQKLKVGQIGVGHFGAYRREKMRETGLFELVAAYDLNPQFMEDAAHEDGAKLCMSYDELLNTPGLEAVVISTGAKFHAAHMLAAMKKGLHVFVEKPLCATPEELSTLLTAQKQSNVVVGVGHTDHTNEKYSRQIKAMIKNGEIGDVVSVEATTCHSGGWVIGKGDWRGDPRKNPGGILFHCGVHKLHELMFYCGPIKKVSAMMRYDLNDNTQTADAAVCILQFKSGVLGSLNAYHVTPYKHTISIFGTKANLYFENRGGAGKTLSKQLRAPDCSGAVEEIETIDIGGDEDDCGNLRSWFGAVRNGSVAYPSLEDGARAVAVVFAAEESAQCGYAVSLEQK